MIAAGHGTARRGRRMLSAVGSAPRALLAAAWPAAAAPPPSWDRDAARQLQSQVLAVTKAAAAKDPAGSPEAP